MLARGWRYAWDRLGSSPVMPGSASREKEGRGRRERPGNRGRWTKRRGSGLFIERKFEGVGDRAATRPTDGRDT